MKQLTLLTVACLISLLAAQNFLGINKQIKEAAINKFKNPKTTNRKAPWKTDVPYQTGYFDQIIDHFDYSLDSPHSQTYKMKYIYNGDQWGGADSLSPILFYTGNEAPVEGYWEDDGFITDVLAPQLKGYLLFAEHRYFGESLPFGNDSFTNDNVVYLTTEQALSDYIVFLRYYKNEVLKCPDCPVIAFGGSYGGMLAAWIRMKFPNVVDGAIAGSAPIRAFSNVTDTELFSSIVTWDFGNSTVQNCESTSREGFQRLTKYQREVGDQYKDLNKYLNICDDVKLKSNYDIYIATQWVVNAYTFLGMLDYPFEIDYVTLMPAYPVDFACQAFIGLSSDSSDEEIFTAMGLASRIFYDYENKTTCNNIQDVEIGTVGYQAWDALACSEMAIQLGNNGIDDFFPPAPFDAKAYSDYCNSNHQLRPRYNWPLDFFGGWTLEELSSYSNIFFSNGELDGWSCCGVSQNISDSMIAYTIKGGAHHLDLFKPNDADPEDVKTARQMEINYMNQWIKEKQDRVRMARGNEL